MAEAREFWDELFGPAEGASGGRAVSMRLLRKRGKPFLLLPAQAQAAAAALALYPAQTLRARLARVVLRGLLRAGCFAGTERVTFTFTAEAPFPSFVRAMAQTSAGIAPCFGVLAGNPALSTQRFLVLVFNERQQPAAVIKAGCNPAARTLIQKEAAFLTAAAGRSATVPRLRASFQADRVSALALDYAAGRSPRPQDTSTLPELLSAWVDSKTSVALAQMPAWNRLEQAAAGTPGFAALAQSLRARELHPALYHGDFAPWNIKVAPGGQWTVLDWERGELIGPPAWDWYHYVVQPGILVERLSTTALVARIEALLSSAPFQAYAARAGIAGRERPLLLAYLLQCVEVIQPTEGLAQTRELLNALRSGAG